MDIHGVPYFIISCEGGQRVALSGAQPVTAFEAAFKRALQLS